MDIYGLQKSTLLDFPEHLACTVFTGGCNFRCPWCHNQGLVERIDVTKLCEDDIFDFINQRIGILDGVAITGGEPLMQEDISDFIVKIKDLGLKVKLDTNGYFPVKLFRLIDDGLLDYVAMDVKNCRGKYAQTCGLEHMETTLIWDSIDILKSWGENNGGRYEFRTTVVDELHEESDIEQIGVWVDGAKKHYIQPYKNPNEGEESLFHAPPIGKLIRFQDILQQHVETVEIRGVLT